MKKRILFLFVGVLIAMSSPAQILKRLEDKVNRKIENAIDRKVDNTIDKILDKITDPKPSEKSSQSKGETEVHTKTTPSPDNKQVVKTKEQVELSNTSVQNENQDNCEKEAEMKKGTWLQSVVYNYEYPTPNEKRFTPNMEKVMDAIADVVINSNPAPVGSKAEWEKWFIRSGDTVSTPDRFLHSYQFVGKFLPFICNYGKVEPYGITDTWLFIRVNAFHHSEVTQQRQINTTFDDMVFSLGKQAGTLGGYPYFKPEPTGIRQIPAIVYHSVLIHRSGKLPYVPVTRGELLEMCKKWITMVESGKQKATGNSVSMRANLDKLYNLNKDDLDKPAIIQKAAWDFNELSNIGSDTQNIFTTPVNGYQLLRPDFSYVDQSVSKWRPQFMVVSWYKVAGKQNSAELDKVMKEQFDFKKLETLMN